MLSEASLLGQQDLIRTAAGTWVSPRALNSTRKGAAIQPFIAIYLISEIAFACMKGSIAYRPGLAECAHVGLAHTCFNQAKAQHYISVMANNFHFSSY